VEIFRNSSDLKVFLSKQKCLGKKLGFVPTMGFLHMGHVSLMERSKKENDVSIVSIFINPAQFNDPLDFEKYPRNEDKDIEICKKANVDVLYLPDTTDIYPNGFKNDLKMNIPSLMDKLCGLKRPGHFEGVLLVISRLFHIIEAHKCYFGFKDYQQYKIIEFFSRILGFNSLIIGMDTIREKSGLAMSSRNSRLSNDELENATYLYRSLKIAKESILKKKTGVSETREIIKDILLTSKLVKIDYIEILNADNLDELVSPNGNILIALAVFIGNVRLIDNIIFSVN
jgi:pantoate--beta-alanine ligase